jgi:hypothetical protein
MPDQHILIAIGDDLIRTYIERVCAQLYPTATVLAVGDGAVALSAFATCAVVLVIISCHHNQ